MKHKEMFIILAFIFIFSIIIRSILAIKFCEPNVWYDELLHWKLSDAFFNEGSLSFRGYNTDRKSILYSIVLSLAHIIPNNIDAQNLAQIINSILMSSAIFPAYLIGKKISSSNKVGLLVGIIAISIPEMFFTGKLIQENLYYPMMMWFWYVIIKNIIKEKKEIKSIIGLAILNVILYAVKDIALSVFLGVVIYYIISIIIEKNKIKERSRELIVYISTFMLGMTIYSVAFAYMNNIQPIVIETTSYISVLLNRMADINIVLSSVYQCIIYLVNCILVWGIFPVIIPFSMFNSLDEKDKHILYLWASILIVSIGMIFITITTMENLGQLNIRVHYRYLFYYFTPILAIFLKYYRIVKDKLDIGLYSIIILGYTVLILLIDIIPIIGPKASQIDGPSLQIMRLFTTWPILSISFKITRQSKVL